MILHIQCLRTLRLGVERERQRENARNGEARIICLTSIYLRIWKYLLQITKVYCKYKKNTKSVVIRILDPILSKFLVKFNTERAGQDVCFKYCLGNYNALNMRWPRGKTWPHLVLIVHLYWIWASIWKPETGSYPACLQETWTLSRYWNMAINYQWGFLQPLCEF